MLLIELPNHLFKLDIWCVMTPGWDQRKPSAVLCRDQICGQTWLHWLQEQGQSSLRQSRLGRGAQRLMGAFGAWVRIADTLIRPLATPGHGVIPEHEG